MINYEDNFSNCCLAEFNDEDLNQTDKINLILSYDNGNLVYSVEKNKLKRFKEWIAWSHWYLNETEQYHRFYNGIIDVDKFFDEVGLKIYEIKEV